MTLDYLTLVIDYTTTNPLKNPARQKADPNVTTERNIQHKMREDFISRINIRLSWRLKASLVKSVFNYPVNKTHCS